MIEKQRPTKANTKALCVRMKDAETQPCRENSLKSLAILGNAVAAGRSRQSSLHDVGRLLRTENGLIWTRESRQRIV